MGKYWFYSHWWEFGTSRPQILSAVCFDVHPFQDLIDYFPSEGKDKVAMICFNEITQEEYDLFNTLNTGEQ